MLLFSNLKPKRLSYSLFQFDMLIFFQTKIYDLIQLYRARFSQVANQQGVSKCLSRKNDEKTWEVCGGEALPSPNAFSILESKIFLTTKKCKPTRGIKTSVKQTMHKNCPHKVKSNEDLFFAPPKIGNHVWHLSMKFLYETERACLVEVICLPYLLLVESSASPLNLDFRVFPKSLRYGDFNGVLQFFSSL